MVPAVSSSGLKKTFHFLVTHSLCQGFEWELGRVLPEDDRTQCCVISEQANSQSKCYGAGMYKRAESRLSTGSQPMDKKVIRERLPVPTCFFFFFSFDVWKCAYAAKRGWWARPLLHDSTWRNSSTTPKHRSPVRLPIHQKPQIALNNLAVRVWVALPPSLVEPLKSRANTGHKAAARGKKPSPSVSLSVISSRYSLFRDKKKYCVIL